MHDKRLPFVILWVLFVCTSAVLLQRDWVAFVFYMKCIGMAAVALAPVAFFFWWDQRAAAQKGGA